MIAIIKRELSSYFSTAIGYAYLTVFFFFCGFYFFAYNLVADSTDMSYLFLSLFNICIFIIPVLTMRLLSEERKGKTEQLLLTSPISLTALMSGKYLAALVMFTCGLLPVPLMVLIMDMFSTPDWAVVAGHMIGTLLLGAALISIGLFISALTENQVVAAVGGFAAGLVLIMLDGFAGTISNPMIRQLVASLSFSKHYLSFTQGLVNINDVVFFLSISVMFVFFAGQVFCRSLGRKQMGSSVLLAVGVIAVALLTNVLCGMVNQRFSLTIDLTPERIFALSQQSDDYLRELDTPVSIIVMTDGDQLERGGGYYTQAKLLLDQYDRKSSQVTVNYIDPIKNPTAANTYIEYKPQPYDIFVTCGGKVERTSVGKLFNVGYGSDGSVYIKSSKAEQEITSAIVRATAKRTVTVSLLIGQEQSYSDALLELLTKNGYEVASGSLITGKLDPSIDVLFLLAPQQDISAQELEMLDDFMLNNGSYGKTLVYAPPSTGTALPNMDSYIAQWGVQVGVGLVVETDPNYMLNNMGYLCAAEYTSSDYTASLPKGAPVVVPMGRELSVAFELLNGCKTQVLISYSKGSCIMPANANASWRPDTAQAAARPAAIRSTLAQFGSSTSHSQVITLASAAMLDSYSLQSSSAANAEYILGMLGALTNSNASIAIAPKHNATKTLGLNQLQVMLLTGAFMLLLPMAVLAGGVVNLFRRRRR